MELLTTNNVWMMVCTFLVFFMHLGFTFLEVGATRQKNSINILFKNFFVITAGLIIYCAIGFGSDSADAFYVGAGESAICNVSFGYSKEIKITDDYSLPLFSSFIFNPKSEAAFIVFGASF